MLLLFARGAKRFFASAVFFACLSALAEMLRPKIIEYTVDGILGKDATAIPAVIQNLLAGVGGLSFLLTHLWIPALAVIAVTLLAVLLRYFYDMCILRGGETFVCTMRNHLFARLERLSPSWHSSQKTGDLIQRCTTDVEMIKSFLTDQFARFFSMLMTIVLALIFMFRIQRQLTLLALISVPLIVGISLWFHRGITDGFLRCDEEEGVLSTIAQENLSGVRVVRAFGKERWEQQRFSEENEVVTNRWIALGRFMTTFFFFIDFLSGLVVLLLLAFGSALCVKGNLSVGRLIALLSYMTMLLRPVRSMGRILSEMSKAGVSVGRIFAIMKEAGEAQPEEEDAKRPPMDGDIVFDGVTFAYPSQPDLFHQLQLTIPGGSTLGILGTTGSGKSTLIQLLAGFYPLAPEQGKITISGVDIREIPTDWLRKHIGYVMQEPYLFSRSIAENILITQEDSEDDLTPAQDATGGVFPRMRKFKRGDVLRTRKAKRDDVPRTRKAEKDACPRTRQEKLRQVTHIAALTETIAHFPKGYDTFVGERGVTLSGGQKQRTAIARALVPDAPILIFDDSLSAVDAETDVIIRQRLREAMGKATVILISHRITTLMAADAIVVLKDGQVVDSGTHRELIGRKGLYRDIYALQSGKEVPDDGAK